MLTLLQVMDPVRSRCLCVRVPAPSHMAVQDQLTLVAKKEGFSLPGDLGARIALASARNMRRALLMMEVAYVQYGVPLPEDTKINPPDWEMYIAVSMPLVPTANGLWLYMSPGVIAGIDNQSAAVICVSACQ